MKRQIPLIAIAVFSVSLLLSFDLVLKPVYAIGVLSNEYENTPSSTTTGIGYNSNFEYLMAYDTAGANTTVWVLDANDLSVVDDVQVGSTSISSNCIDNECIVNTASHAILVGTNTATSPDTHLMVKINLNTFALTTLSNNTASLDGCSSKTGQVLIGSSLYFWMAGATCGERGVYVADTGATSGTTWINRVYDNANNFGMEDGCYSSDAGKIVWTRQSNSNIVVFTLGGSHTQLDLTDVVNHVYCVPNTDLAIVTSSAGNWIKLVDVGGAPTVISTTTVTGAFDIVKHANDVYVSRTGSSSATICEYSTSASGMTCSATVTVASSALLISGNSTAFYALNNPSGSDGIAYAIFGLESDDNDEGSDIVNGVNCALAENADTLLCRLNDINTSGSLSSTSTLINQSSTNIICQIGILECTEDANGNFVPTDPNIQTNGIGYLMVAISMGVFVGILWVAGRGDLTSIPTFVWFIGTIAVIGTITAFGWIDPTFLVISIVVIVAMAVAKAKGVFTAGQGLFAGEAR